MHTLTTTGLTVLLPETLFGVLVRLLREDGSHDVVLATNIVYIFFCFSNFSQFHPFLSQSQVGNTCLQIVELQLEAKRKLEEQQANSKKKPEPKDQKEQQLLSGKGTGIDSSKSLWYSLFPLAVEPG
jgi:hypothetical protein